MSGLRKKVLSAGVPKMAKRNPVNYNPQKWNKYFTKHERIRLDYGEFHYYTRGHEGPLCVAIHGGGYSALTWALFAEELGARINVQFFAVDLRGHGSTSTDNDSDLELQRLTGDVVDFISKLVDLVGSNPPVILLGHSLGGCIAVEVAKMLPSVVGMCIIDVVEGTAMDSLASMQSVLRGRPASFDNIQQAVYWGHRGGTTLNAESARVSMPGQIVNSRTGELASMEIENAPSPEGNMDETTVKKIKAQSSIIEEEEGEEGDESGRSSVATPPPPEVETGDKYVWRINLSKTEQFWTGWFRGLSEKFLSVPVPKLLILASISGLDTSLTVGQMQGKFQLQVLNRCGHAMHEDRPSEVADVIAHFLLKQKLVEAASAQP